MEKYILNKGYSVTVQDGQPVITDGSQKWDITWKGVKIFQAIQNQECNLESIVEYVKEHGVTVTSYTEGTEDVLEPDDTLSSEVATFLDDCIESGWVLKC